MTQGNDHRANRKHKLGPDSAFVTLELVPAENPCPCPTAPRKAPAPERRAGLERVPAVLSHACSSPGATKSVLRSQDLPDQVGSGVPEGKRARPPGAEGSV